VWFNNNATTAARSLTGVVLLKGLQAIEIHAVTRTRCVLAVSACATLRNINTV